MVEIAVGPNLFSSGVLELSWHGFFSFVAVATAVYLVGRWAPLRRIPPDTVYSIAVWAIVGGVIGARAVHVIDFWDTYRHTPGEIFAVWNGGIGVWGGILGGFIGGTIYTLSAGYLDERRGRRTSAGGTGQHAADEGVGDQGYRVGVIADLAAPAMLIAQTIGRLGDIVNGEHCSKVTGFFLGFQWTAPDTTARGCDYGYLNTAANTGTYVQPAIAYEMIWNMIALFIVWKLRGRLRPDGMLFALYLALYAAGRLVIGFARLESKEYALGLNEAQYIALLVLAVTVPLLAIKARLTERVEMAPLPAGDVAPQRGTRAERRRRTRRGRS